MHGPRDYYTKWSKSEKQIPYNITYMWAVKYHTKWTYLQNRNKTHRPRKQTMVTKSKGRDKLRVWIKIYTLIYIYKIDNLKGPTV